MNVSGRSDGVGGVGDFNVSGVGVGVGVGDFNVDPQLNRSSRNSNTASYLPQVGQKFFWVYKSWKF